MLCQKRGLSSISNNEEASKKTQEGSLNLEPMTSTTLDISTNSKEVFNYANEHHYNNLLDISKTFEKQVKELLFLCLKIIFYV